MLAYDGTRFSGWQRQSRQRRDTVQATLEAALTRVTGRRTTVTGAGRTDAGVHALGQVAHARVVTRLSLVVLQRALNAVLPEDIVIRHLARAPGRFHAQRNAVRKWYRYRLATGPVRPIFERASAHYVRQPLDLRAMRRAARAWIGRHDFRAFHSAGRPARSTVRRLHRLRLTREKRTASRSGPFLCIDLVADGFLYHMARRMVGALLLIGTGRWPPEAARQLLTRRTTLIAPTAPARGLCLMQVFYD